MVQTSVAEVSRETKRKPAFVKFAIPDHLAEKLIANSLVAMNFFRSDWPVVGLTLSWQEVEYHPEGYTPPELVKKTDVLFPKKKKARKKVANAGHSGQ